MKSTRNLFYVLVYTSEKKKDDTDVGSDPFSEHEHTILLGDIFIFREFEKTTEK